MKKPLLLAERSFFAAGLVLVAFFAFRVARYQVFQSHPAWFGAVPIQTAATPGLENPSVHNGSVSLEILGQLRIPRLGLSVQVLEGDSDENLSLGAGHVPGTAAPGEAGNFAIAGHRDTVFRVLRRLRRGDDIWFVNASGRFVYHVDSLAVVKPEDTQAVEASDSPVLTLITCYPFYYVGSAPKRFIVRASLASS